MKQKNSFHMVTIVLIIILLSTVNLYTAQISLDSDLNDLCNVYSDITYKTINGQNLKLDIYKPKKKGNIPVVVYVHGGNWDYGDKKEELNKYYLSIFKGLILNDYIVVSIDYRLTSDQNHFPLPVIDGKDAIRFLRKNSDKYNINSDKISIWGTSAGAHISQIIAFSSDDQFTGDVSLNEYTAKVNLLINCFGPVDMRKIFRVNFSSIEVFFAKLFMPGDYQKLLTLSRHFSGLSFEDERDELDTFCKTYTTTNFINQYNPPVLILHGQDDKTVEPEHSILLKNKLDEYQVANILKEYDGVEHSFKNANPEQIQDIINSMNDFLKEYND